MANRPDAEIDITLALARQLVGGQFPELNNMRLAVLSRGWDNTNFRLGDNHIVRIPHREAAAPLIVHEQRWLPEIAQLVSLSIPTPTHHGEPTDDYPWRWSITPWFPGEEAATATLDEPQRTVEILAEFYNQLHVSAPADAVTNPYRGGPLRECSARFESRVTSNDAACDIQAIAAVFDRALVAEPSSQQVWLHGDLHGRNMIVHHGRLSAVIDWGDLCTGDRATDLAGAYMLVPDHLDELRSRVNATDADWERARGWAAHFAVMYLTHSDDDPVMGSIGARLCDTLLATHGA